VEAVKWYRLAADHGDVNAQFALGKMYGQGKGVRQDHAEAVKWLRKAAAQGHAMAKQILEKME
jgi:TPR repeat protein